MVGALAVAAFILSPPVDRFADASRSVQMAQHMVLAFLVSPLLVKAEAVRLMTTSLPLMPISRHKALVAWLGFVATMVFWHLPRPMEWASARPMVHALEILCFLGSGILFWSVLLKVGGRRMVGDGAAVLYCGSALAVTDLVGAIMTLSQRLLCRSDLGRAAVIGLTDLQDQQLAGMLMWLPGALILLVFFAVLFPAWLNRGAVPQRFG